MHFRLLLFAFSLILARQSDAQESPQTKPSKARKYPVEVKLSRHYSMEDTRVFELVISIEAGYAIYANPPDNRDLDWAQTTVRVTSQQKEIAANIAYPFGRAIKAGQENFRVYKHEAKVVAKVKEAILIEPVEFVVVVQPIDPHGACLPLKKLVVPFKKN